MFHDWHLEVACFPMKQWYHEEQAASIDLNFNKLFLEAYK